MTQQQPEQIVTEVEAARALTQSGFLGSFLEAASPSDVARKLGMRANLAHHHARKAERLGLLFRLEPERGRVLYQLSARVFRVPYEVRPPAADTRTVEGLTAAYLDANLRSMAQQHLSEAAESMYVFGSAETVPASPAVQTDERCPAFLVQRTLSLTPERYRRLLRRIEQLIKAEEDERDAPGATVCTVATLAFEGSLQPGQKSTTTTTSFFPPQQDNA